MAGYGGETTIDRGLSGRGSALRSNRRFPRKVLNNENIISTHKVGSTITSLYTSSATAAKGVLLAPESVSIRNQGGAPTAIIIKFNYWTDSGVKDANPKYLQFIVGANENINVPMSRAIISDDSNTIYNGTELAQAAPDSNMSVVSGATVNNGEGGDHVINSTSATNLWLAEGEWTSITNGSFLKFAAGDLIRIGTEIMEITAVSGADGTTNNYLTVIRGANGSTAATHSNGDVISFAFFNAYHNFTAATGGYDVPQTDNDGKFKATNFFGVGRGSTYLTSGILTGSVSIKFYEAGYQELGLSGVSPSTKTGLTGGTAYQFNIAVDGASATSISFTVDANNIHFGGRNGIISKIQEALDTQFHTTSSNMFEKKVRVAVLDGDVRFTSGQCLSTSAIALTDSAGSDTDIWGVGRIPTVAKLATAVAATLPENSVNTRTTNQSITNISKFLYDDGKGNLVGRGRGTINYETGAIAFVSKQNAEFVVSARYAGALSGSVSTSSFNTIEDISAISASSIIETSVTTRITGYALDK